jgi:tripartite-type tricarboxylate transporter receptor subunit TctC
MSIRRIVARVSSLVLLSAAATAPATADAVSDFYVGKKVTIVVAAGPGGGHTQYSQLLAPYFKKYMTGNPSFVTQNMGGAGGTKAANYLYNSAAQDGSVIGILLSDTPFASRLRTTGVKYKPERFHYLGGADNTQSAFVVFKSAGVKTLEEAKTKQVLMGSTGKGSQTYVVPTLVNALLGTKFKVITGYRGMGGIYLAMDRGEVLGFQSVYSSPKSLRPQWFDQNKLVVLAANSLSPIADHPSVPLIKDLVTNATDKKILEIIGGNGILGRGWLATPGTPKARVAALRTAVEKALNDRDVMAAAKKRRMSFAPVKWEEMQAHAKRIGEADDALFVRVRKLLKAK